MQSAPLVLKPVRLCIIKPTCETFNLKGGCILTNHPLKPGANMSTPGRITPNSYTKFEKRYDSKQVIFKFCGIKMFVHAQYFEVKYFSK